MKNNLLKDICTALVCFFIVGNIDAMPAYPFPVDYKLPDGTTITLTLQGDEFHSWSVSTDGYTLLRNADGYFEYAQKDASDNLVLSGVRARDMWERTFAETCFLSTISKNLNFSKGQIANARQQRRARSLTPHAAGQQNTKLRVNGLNRQTLWVRFRREMSMLLQILLRPIQNRGQVQIPTNQLQTLFTIQQTEQSSFRL